MCKASIKMIEIQMILKNRVNFRSSRDRRKTLRQKKVISIQCGEKRKMSIHADQFKKQR